MNDAMYIAATGMQAQQTQLDVIANNVANVSTPGFKRGSVNFSDLVHRAATDGAPDAATAQPLPGLSGAGVAIGAVGKQFAPGDLTRTGNAMDLAIQGAGFIEVLLPDGSTGYSRGGTLQINADRMLSTVDGYVLKQRIQVPTGATGVTIAATGEVTAADAHGASRSLGRIDLVTFANPAALLAQGDNVYRAAPDAGDALVAVPGEAGAGNLAQGQLEQSNVKLVDEMVQLMVAQRAYEMNVKVIQAADDIASMVNNIRK